MDVLAELSYVSMTPEHFPSMFCKVSIKNRNNDSTDWPFTFSVTAVMEELWIKGKVLDLASIYHVLLSAVGLQEMSVGYANGIRVMSMTHTGEPGFMLYIPIEVNSHLQT